MNFFQHQEQARKQSRRMIVLFTLAVIAIVVAVNAVVYLVLGFSAAASENPGTPRVDIQVFATIGALLVIGLASAYRISSLRRGGAVIARQLGGTSVPATPREFAYQRLRNVVEEIAIASGVPVPEIFVLEDETAINAFAAGYTPADAAITVTRGCLDTLTREELQGVIAHEFSHVLNGDMRLNIRLMGVAFGILAIAVMGRVIMRGASRSRQRKGGSLIL
ncbi:MAG: peptidase M48 Ste24p, partial [Gammaproteobacteria bacterium]